MKLSLSISLFIIIFALFIYSFIFHRQNQRDAVERVALGQVEAQNAHAAILEIRPRNAAIAFLPCRVPTATHRPKKKRKGRLRQHKRSANES
jgi:uncharacterized protein (DUF58 family)